MGRRRAIATSPIKKAFERGSVEAAATEPWSPPENAGQNVSDAISQVCCCFFATRPVAC